MRNTRTKYTILPLLCLAGVAFQGIVGIMGFIGLFASASVCIKQWYEKRALPAPLFFSIITVLSSIIIVQTAIYMLYGITPLSIFLIAFLLFIVSLKNQPLPLSFPRFNKEGLALAISIILGEAVLLSLLVLNATTGAMPSPWLALDWKFFSLFAITSFLLLTYHKKTENKYVSLFLNIVHYFVAFSVVSLLYPIGYGYDPFLHRAAEEHIMAYGSIDPKTPFYIGQYVLVALFGHLSHLPIKLLDIWLVPVFASILIPLAARCGFTKGFGMTEKKARIATLFLLIFPLQYFYATTPYNFSVLLVFIGILLAPILLTNKTARVPLFLLALAALCVHPLAGVFLASLVMLFAIQGEPKKQMTLTVLIALLSSISIPLLFFVYGVLQGHATIALHSSYETIQQFLSLFKDPYYVTDAHLNIVLGFVYIYQKLIPILIIAAACYGFFAQKDKRLRPLMILPFIVLANIFLLITFVSLPSLSTYEQLQYAERLRHLLILPLLPLAVMGTMELVTRYTLHVTHRLFIVSCFLFLAIPLTVSLYLTYPQYNAHVHSRGYNVTQADIDAVHWIAQDAKDEQYVVLSNIMTAAAAVDQFGFQTYYDAAEGKAFFYAIPSGGILANYFNAMLYEGQKREFTDEVMKQLGVSRVYFLVSDYWHNAPEVIPGATKTADAVYAIDGGKIMIFIYNY